MDGAQRHRGSSRLLRLIVPLVESSTSLLDLGFLELGELCSYPSFVKELSDVDMKLL